MDIDMESGCEICGNQYADAVHWESATSAVSVAVTCDDCAHQLERLRDGNGVLARDLVLAFKASVKAKLAENN